MQKSQLIIWNFSNSSCFHMVSVKPSDISYSVCVCELPWGDSSVRLASCWTFMLHGKRDSFVARRGLGFGFFCTATVKYWRAGKRALQKSRKGFSFEGIRMASSVAVYHLILWNNDIAYESHFHMGLIYLLTALCCHLSEKVYYFWGYSESWHSEVFYGKTKKPLCTVAKSVSAVLFTWSTTKLEKN